MKNEALGSWAKRKVRGSLTPEKFLEDSLIRPLSRLLLLPAPIPATLRVFCFYNRYFTLCVALTWGIGKGWMTESFLHLTQGQLEPQLNPCIAVPRLNLRTTFLQNVLEWSLFYNSPTDVPKPIYIQLTSSSIAWHLTVHHPLVATCLKDTF